MIFYYLITDTDSGEKTTYSVEACDKRAADELFIKRFFPLLPHIEMVDIRTLVDICKDLDYQIEFINSEKVVKL